MPYAVVQDIPASWDHYEKLAQALGDPGPDGLIIHVAGPTDEGFRTIEIWETREACERFHESAPDIEVHASSPTVASFRDLRAVRAVRGVTPSSARAQRGC